MTPKTLATNSRRRAGLVASAIALTMLSACAPYSPLASYPPIEQPLPPQPIAEPDWPSVQTPGEPAPTPSLARRHYAPPVIDEPLPTKLVEPPVVATPQQPQQPKNRDPDPSTDCVGWWRICHFL
jgi:hypothetical protein